MNRSPAWVHATLPLVLLTVAVFTPEWAHARQKVRVAVSPIAKTDSTTTVAPVAFRPVRKKLVYVGADSPTSSQFRRDTSLMREPAVDGFVVWAEANGVLPDGVGKSPFRRPFVNQLGVTRFIKNAG